MNKERLTELDFKSSRIHINKNYSRFIRYMRFILPVCALILTVIVITWSKTDNQIAVIQKEDILPNTDLAENELINPKFQSADKDLNPYIVTANRAIQNGQNPNLIKLYKPKGNISLKDGNKLNISSDLGSYEQKQEKLFLEQNVILNHQSGYILNTEELRINLKKGQAFSDKEVTINGIKGNIKASGLDGDLEKNIIIFKGPATLTLTPQNIKNKNGELENDL